MRIRALSVFEGVVYHCWCVDPSQPGKPTLEVEAVVREGDVDGGPLLLPVPDYVAMVGGPEAAKPHLEALAERGRIVGHLDVPHIRFPTWTPVSMDRPGQDPGGPPADEPADDVTHPSTPPALRPAPEPPAD